MCFSYRYIDRFRHGPPLSREEREKEMAKQPDFWWISQTSTTIGSRISEPSDTSTPKDGVTGLKTRRRTPRDTARTDGSTMVTNGSATTEGGITLNVSYQISSRKFRFKFKIKTMFTDLFRPIY